MLLKNLIEKGIFSAILTALLIFFSAQASGEDLGGIRSGEVRSSSIDPVGDSDTFNFYGSSGETVVIIMSETGSSTVWPYLQLYDPDWLLETEGYDSIVNHQLLKSGLYTIVCRDVGDNDTGAYNLSFLKIPGPVLSPSDKDGGDIISGEVLPGEINPVADTDGFNFYGNSGETVVIIMSETGGSAVWPYLQLYDPDWLLETEGYDSIENYQLLKSGLYTIVCRDVMDNDTGAYNLSLTKIPTTLPPGVYNPTPANGALVSHTTNLLDWSDTVGATHYDVYFGTNVTIPLTKIAENITASSCSLSPLLVDTTYYWKVVAKNGSTDIPGPVWIFTTQYLKNDLLGTWDGSGVWYRDSETGSWVKMSIPAQSVAAGDIDGDGTDDLIGVWSSGVWAKYSSTGTWAKICTPLPSDIASGDMDGDGRDDILGTWSSGVWYKNSVSGTWVLMTSYSANLVAAGDLDGDNTADLIGTWSSGLWVKLSSTGTWAKLTASLPNQIASGDMNGDGRDDVVGTWPSGVWYKDSVSGTWVKMCSVPAYLVTADDIDGDGTDDLIGTWSSGLWVKYSETGTWQKICTPLPMDIDAGLFRSGWGAGAMNFEGPIGGVYVEGPDSIDNYVDLSSEGPGGWNFAFQVEENLVPQEKGLKIMMRVPGPGEPGFKYIEQRNLVPQEGLVKKRGKKK